MGNRTTTLPGAAKAQAPSSQTAPLLQYSLFTHARSNNPILFTATWAETVQQLTVNREPTPGNLGGTPKRSMPAISPAHYPPGVPRGIANALGVSLLLLDFDNSTKVQTGKYHFDKRTGLPSNRPVLRDEMIADPVQMHEVVAVQKHAGVAAFAWTTWSSTPAWPKFRVIVPLAQPVQVGRWAVFSEWALTALGLDPFRRGLDLPVLRNPVALAFLPGSPTPETIVRMEIKGDHLCIPADLPTATPPPPLQQWQLDAVKARMDERSAGGQWWRAYRLEDGSEIDFASLDLVALFEAAGIKVGEPRQFKDGSKWRCHCPWASEHSHQDDDDSCVVIKTPGTWPSWKCQHSGHAHMGLQDVIGYLWGAP